MFKKYFASEPDDKLYLELKKLKDEKYKNIGVGNFSCEDMIVEKGNKLSFVIFSNSFQFTNFDKCMEKVNQILKKDGVTALKIESKNGKKIELLVCYDNPNFDKVVIFSHGNASSNEQMYYYLKDLSRKLNICVIGYDYQGYGNSEGIPSEQNCYDDLESVVNYVKTNTFFDHIYKIYGELNNIFLMGQSLGTGITMHYVSENDWKNPVILVSPYKSIFTVVFKEDSSFMMSSARNDMFTTEKKLPKINCPIKIFHGINDRVISVDHSKKLFKNLPNKKFKPTYYDFCGHNDILERISTSELMEVLKN